MTKKGYITNIEKETLNNERFRKVLYTSSYLQLVLMTIPEGGEIGEEVHGVDQFIRIEEGKAKAIINGNESDMQDDFIAVVPAGATHNFINTGDGPLKLYTLYGPPHHEDGIVHATKADADTDDEEFMGVTSE